MGFKNSLKNDFIDNTILAGNRYVALFSVAPDNDGAGGTELSGSGYARKLFTDWTAAVDGVAENNTEFEFAAASGDWVQAVAFAIYDALSGGNFIGWGSLTTPKTVTSGGIARFQAGDLVVDFT